MRILSTIEYNSTLSPESSAGLFQYGAPSGDPKFLRALQQFLQQEYQDSVDIRDLVTTSGASSGLFYILSMLFPQRCTVFCEDHTYMIALETMRYLQFNVVPVELQPDGLNISDLESAFQQHADEPTNGDGFRGVLYVVPTFHNPTGLCYSPEKCHRIISLARKYQILVIADDVYNLLYYEGSKPPKRLFAYDEKDALDYKGNVISNGSFSKYLSPGLRVGWLEAPAWFVGKHWCDASKHTYGFSPVIDSGGCLNMFTSGIIGQALEDGAVQQMLNTIRHEYKTAYEAVETILKTELPKGCRFDVNSKGGFFIWLNLPENLSANAVLKESTDKYGVKFMPGSRFRATAKPNGDNDNSMRLCFAYYEIEEVCDAVRKLCSVINDLVQ